MRVLWLSRNELTCEQVRDLQRIYPDLEVKHCSENVKDWKAVLELGSDCDVLAVALPIPMLAELVKPSNNKKPVIRSTGSWVPTGDKVTNPVTGEPEEHRVYKHIGWELVERVVVETKRL